MSVHTENASKRIEKLTYHIDDHNKHYDKPGERDERRYLVLVGFFEYLKDKRQWQVVLFNQTRLSLKRNTKAEDIMQIPGIKEGVYSKIQDQIIVR